MERKEDRAAPTSMPSFSYLRGGVKVTTLPETAVIVFSSDSSFFNLEEETVYHMRQA